MREPTEIKKLWSAGELDRFYKEQNARLRAHGIAYNEVVEDQILAQFGSWAVTTYGLECLDSPYAIPKERLGKHDHILHMAEKNWVVMYDFVRAFRAAQAHFGFEELQTQGKRLYARSRKQKISKGKRFKILRRDGYRCQLCGRTAQEDGVKLEVDHKIPESKGGPTKPSNLWTLCFDCNRGKGVRSL